MDLTEKEKRLQEELYRMQMSPIYFAKKVRNIVPQKHKITQWERWKEEWPFKLADFEEFEKGKQITRQQTLILYSLEKAINKLDKRQITIRSGHWIGKSSALAIIVLWFLFCFVDSQVPCTAPTSDQLHDILRKEISLRHGRMPHAYKDMYDITSDYVRMKSRVNSRFARARTGRKENPEALAWVHSDFVLLVADEASWVANEIYDSSKGAMTNKMAIMVMISNPTRLDWYFYDSHHKFSEQFQTLHFNSEDSPIVDRQFVNQIISEKWLWSDEYAIRVRWEFPKADMVDDKWFVPLLMQSDIRQVEDIDFTPFIMGVDVAGEGRDETVRVVRDNYTAKVVAREKISTPLWVATKTESIARSLNIKAEDTYVDSFGIWSDSAIEMAKLWFYARGINVGEKARDEYRYINIRSEIHWLMRERACKWWQFVMHEWRNDLLKLKYKRELNGKIKIMSKEDIRKLYWKSPDFSDALCLTFVSQKNTSELNEIYWWLILGSSVI